MPVLGTELMVTLIKKHATPGMIEKYLKAGVLGFRQTLAYDTFDDHVQRLKMIRTASRKTEITGWSLWDFPGEKARFGPKVRRKRLKVGQKVVLSRDPKTKGLHIDMSDHVYGPIKIGHRLVACDGYVQFEVYDIKRTGLKVKTLLSEEPIGSFKGFNLPDTDVEFESFTKDDIDGMRNASFLNPDYVVVSFTSNSRDVLRARRILDEANPNNDIKVIGKIETRVGVKNVDAIARNCDGLMIGRGDLALNTSFAELPRLQWRIMESAAKHDMLSIVATELNDSMEKSPIPLRSEAIDIANAIYQGASVLMVSGEVARGNYVFESIQFMQDVIKKTRSDIKQNPERSFR